MAATVKEQITAGQLADSQQSWIDLLGFIDKKSASVVSVRHCTPRVALTRFYFEDFMIIYTIFYWKTYLRDTPSIQLIKKLVPL
jgi:hypothetical protein